MSANPGRAETRLAALSTEEVRMDAKRLVSGTVVGGIGITVFGVLLYSVLFADWFATQTMVAPKDTPVIWAAVVSALTHGALLTLVLGWAGSTSWVAGLKTGALVGVLLWFGVDMILFALSQYTTLPGAFADAGLAIVQYGISGAAVGAVLGMGGPKAA
jgi:hypothetical protein